MATCQQPASASESAVRDEGVRHYLIDPTSPTGPWEILFYFSERRDSKRRDITEQPPVVVLLASLRVLACLPTADFGILFLGCNVLRRKAKSKLVGLLCDSRDHDDVLR